MNDAFLDNGVAEVRDAGQNQALLATADGPAEQLVCSLVVAHPDIQALEGKGTALLRELLFRSAPVGGYPPDLLTPRPIRREVDVSAVSRPAGVHVVTRIAGDLSKRRPRSADRPDVPSQVPTHRHQHDR